MKFSVSLLILSGAFLLLAAGCSEDQAPPLVDPEPQVKIFSPAPGVLRPNDVEDSTMIYVGAFDLDEEGTVARPDTIRFWYADPRGRHVMLWKSADPISLQDVPEDQRDEIVLPEGWWLYGVKWYTGPNPRPPDINHTPINSNTVVNLYATADDGTSTTRSDFVPVRIFNQGDNLMPPFARFTVFPTGGIANETVFQFDPSATADSIYADSLVQVRWDFDGDISTWEVGDWDSTSTAPAVYANEIQEWTFTRAARLVITMEARNDYVEGTDIYQLEILVSPKGGRPHPPNPNDFVEIPTGLYTIGTDTVNYPGGQDGTEATPYEKPAHLVDIRQRFRVSKYEVTNQLYLDFLRAAIDSVAVIGEGGGSHMEPPKIEFRSGNIYYRDQIPPADTTDWIYLELNQNLTRIFYDIQSDDFRVTSGYENHPVTGMTWRGAVGYCIFYGLRLPTEAEWEVAARGNHADWLYPFGPNITPAQGRKRINYQESLDWYEQFSLRTTPIGYYNSQVYQYPSAPPDSTIDSPSPYGMYDMSGNVAEWVGDWLDFYPSGTQVDPQGPINGIHRVIRGGSWLSSLALVRVTYRVGAYEDDRFGSVGFRPAYSILN